MASKKIIVIRKGKKTVQRPRIGDLIPETVYQKPLTDEERQRATKDQREMEASLPK